MKFKHLTCHFTIIVVSGGLLLLTGCVGYDYQHLTNSSFEPKYTLKTQAQDSNLPVNKVWANLIDNDGSSINSSIGLIWNNQSPYTITTIGCDNSGKYIEKVTDIIPSGSKPILSSKSSAKWKQFKDFDGGIYDSEHIYDNSLQSFRDLADGEVINCYYAAYFPQADQSLYFKIIYKANLALSRTISQNNLPKADLTKIASHMTANSSETSANSLGASVYNTTNSFIAGELPTASLSFWPGIVIPKSGIIGLNSSLGSAFTYIDANPSFLGNAYSKFITVDIDVPTSLDVTTWNTHHDQSHLINANSFISTAGIAENTAQITKMITFAPSTQVDSNLGLAITLNSVTTPWTRNARNEDAFIGKEAASIKRGDAILAINTQMISNSYPSRDQDKERIRAEFNSEGLPKLAEDNDYKAPKLKLIDILDITHGETLFSPDKNINRLNLQPTSSLPKYSNQVQGLLLNPNQEVDLLVSIPNDPLHQSGVNSVNREQFALGLDASYIGLKGSGNDNSFVEVKSLSLKARYDKNQITSPRYIFSMFGGVYPPKVGNSYPLKLSIGGLKDNEKHQGILYIGDNLSKTTAVPLYINYQLLTDMQSQTVLKGKNKFIHIRVINPANIDYSGIEVSGAPSSLKLLTTNLDGEPSCDKSLYHGSSCELTYDVSNVDPGTYKLLITGITKEGRSKDEPNPMNANVASFNLKVN